MHVALFITCFNDMMFPGTGRAATGLLERLGHTVEFPQGQTCCGQMHFNTGCRPETLPMVFRGGFRGLRRRGPPSDSSAGRVITRPGPLLPDTGGLRVVTDERRMAAVLFIRPIGPLTSSAPAA